MGRVEPKSWIDQQTLKTRQDCSLVTFWYGQSCALPDVRTDVSGTLFDSEHDDAADHGDLDTAEDAQGHCADEGAAVSEVFLEGVDRQQGKVRLLFCIAQEVDIY